MEAITITQTIYLSPDRKTAVFQESVPIEWRDGYPALGEGWSVLALAGQAVSPRVQLQYGIEVGEGGTTIGHELDERYLPTEEDHDDLPAVIHEA